MVLYYFHRMPSISRDHLAHEDRLALARLLGSANKDIPGAVSAGAYMVGICVGECV